MQGPQCLGHLRVRIIFAVTALFSLCMLYSAKHKVVHGRLFSSSTGGKFFQSTVVVAIIQLFRVLASRLDDGISLSLSENVHAPTAASTHSRRLWLNFRQPSQRLILIANPVVTLSRTCPARYHTPTQALWLQINAHSRAFHSQSTAPHLYVSK